MHSSSLQFFNTSLIFNAALFFFFIYIYFCCLLLVNCITQWAECWKFRFVGKCRRDLGTAVCPSNTAPLRRLCAVACHWLLFVFNFLLTCEVCRSLVNFTVGFLLPFTLQHRLAAKAWKAKVLNLLLASQCYHYFLLGNALVKGFFLGSQSAASL